MAKNYLCIHAHFYQPPRENPWLEEIENQHSADPYHDWNERIYWECYAPNGASRLLGEKEKIRAIVNNYQKISFNFGPTLLSWIEKKHPELLKKIIAADQKSCNANRQQGNALAQVYNHLIMPLANERERRTQVRWGIFDFQRYFGRKPEGMWLAETAADKKSLITLAAEGIKFTILSPHQAQKIKPLKDKKWREVNGPNFDPTRPYRCFLNEEKSLFIDIFFYDAPLSQQVSFGGLLNNGENFYQKICQALRSERTHPQIIMVATDGETYGHHTTFGDMALAYLLEKVDKDDNLELINPAQYLAKHQPQYEVEIFEPSSWSCSHGVGRWKDNCGCNSGQHGNWQQKWRKPLRQSLDWLKAEIDKYYLETTADLLHDPWRAKDNYIEVVSNNKQQTKDNFVEKEQKIRLDKEQRVRLFSALEMQRNSMLMYTSCAWFFDELSGLETVQVLRYAARAMQLCRALSAVELEEEFVGKLKPAESNLPQFGNGAEVYRQLVVPSSVDFKRVVANQTIYSFFSPEEKEESCYFYKLKQLGKNSKEKGPIKLITGAVQVSSLLTEAEEKISYAALKIGNQDFHCSLKGLIDHNEEKRIEKELLETFEDGGTTEIIRAIDRNFSTSYFTINDLFLDQRQEIFNSLMQQRLKQLEKTFRQSYSELEDFMKDLHQRGIRLPRYFQAISEWILASDLLQNLKKLFSDNDQNSLKETCQEIANWGLELKDSKLWFAVEQILEERLKTVNSGEKEKNLELLLTALKQLDQFSHNFKKWKMQNYFYLFCQEDNANNDLVKELAEILGFNLELCLLANGD